MKTHAKHFGFAALLLFALLLFFMPGVQAQEASANACIPDEAALEAYRADGTLAERQAYYESLGLNQTDPGLIAQAQARESENANLRSAVPSGWKTGMATTGEANILLIRVDFPDYSFSDNDTEDALKQIAFGPSGEGQPGYPYESLSAYYERSSYGRLHISGQVASYTAKNNRDTYSRSMADLFKEAMTALDAQGMDFSQFDGNRDGLIDGVYIHFAGPDTGWGTAWWSQKMSYGGDPFVLDGVALSDYVTLHDNSASGARTLVHETGHMLGLADYYSYTAQTYENGIRTFDMMCDNTGDHNGFSKWLLGWIDVEDITRVSADDGSAELSLSAISGNGGSKIAVVSPVDSGMFSEYFLVQYDVPGLNNEGIYYPNTPDSGFRVFHINATLNADGSNFLHMNETPAKPKLIEAVGPQNQEWPYTPLFYTDGMRLAPDTTPDSSFFGGMYQAYTGVVMENLNTQNASLSVRFENTPPVVPSLALTPGSPMDNLTNLPTFTFTANMALKDNTTGGARQPVTLEGPDGASYPMHCAISGQSLAVGLADSSNIAALKANTEYTLVFPEKYFDLGQGITSEALRFSVKTGDIPAVLATGVLEQPSSFGGKETELAALSDGRIFRFMGRYKPSGETYFNYFDQVQLLIAGSDFQTKMVDVAVIPDIESYSDIQATSLSDDTLALALYNKTNDTTSLFSVDLDGRVTAGPYTVSGSPRLFSGGTSVKAWQSFYASGEELPGIRIETIDFKNPAATSFIYGERLNSELQLFPVDTERYAVQERVSTGLWEYKDYLSLYSMDSDAPKWRTECTTSNAIIGVAALDGGLVRIETAYAGSDTSAASFTSQYKNVMATTFDKNGSLTEKSRNIGRIRATVDESKNVISVKGGASGIAVESSFTAPALPFLENNNDTECRDYLFMGSGGQTKALSGQNAFPGLWTGDRYLITGRDLNTGRCLYYQTDTLFADTPDTPVTPDTPGTPGGGTDAPADTTAPGTGGSISTGILGTQASLYVCLSLLGTAFCGLALYRKYS